MILASTFSLSVFLISRDHALQFSYCQTIYCRRKCSTIAEKRSRRATVTGENNKAAVLAAVARNPHISTRELASNAVLSQSSTWRIFKNNKYHPYSVSLHRDLTPGTEQIQMKPNFFRSVLFSWIC